jgi:hypothetical protein
VFTTDPVWPKALAAALEPPPRSCARACRNPTRVGAAAAVPDVLAVVALAAVAVLPPPSALTRFVNACSSLARGLLDDAAALVPDVDVLAAADEPVDVLESVELVDAVVVPDGVVVPDAVVVLDGVVLVADAVVPVESVVEPTAVVPVVVPEAVLVDGEVVVAADEPVELAAAEAPVSVAIRLSSFCTMLLPPP